VTHALYLIESSRDAAGPVSVVPLLRCSCCCCWLCCKRLSD